MDRRLQELYRKEDRWELIETTIHVLIFLIAIGCIVIMYALTDVESYPQYIPGVRYELALPALPRL